MGFGVWALVIGMLASAAVNTGASHYVFAGPVMKLAMKREYFSEIFHFGKWLIIASFFGFFVNRGDQIVFGGYMPADRFSLYVIATIWITAASTVMQTLTSRIFYPAFSEIIRERPESLTSAYEKARAIIDAASIALAYGAFFLSGPVFSFVYSDAYEGVGYFVKLLSPFLLLTPFRLINTTILASGDSKRFTAITVLAGISMLVLTPLAFHYLGEKSAVVVFSVIEMVSLPIIWRLGAKRLKLNPMVEGRAFLALILLIFLIFAAS
jgi:O-antigen/teichoic acid export membrane protein